MTARTDLVRTHAPAPDQVMEWRVHLAGAEPRKAAVVVLTILLASGLAGWLWSGLLPALGVALALVGAVAEFLFPIRYRLTPEGVETSCFVARRAIAWAQVRRVYRLPDGVKLSPLERGSRREAFRGLFLRFNGNEAEVMETVSAQMSRCGAGSHSRHD